MKWLNKLVCRLLGHKKRLVSKGEFTAGDGAFIVHRTVEVCTRCGEKFVTYVPTRLPPKETLSLEQPTKTTFKPTTAKTTLKHLIIRHRNLERKKGYKYSKFFKHRQPTTARKLWKPDKKPEE